MKKFIIAFIALAITSSCNSSNDDISTPSNVDTTPILPTTIVVKNNSDSYSTKLSYDGDRIKEAYVSIDTLNAKNVYTYNGNNIIKEELQSLEGMISRIKEYSYSNDGKLISVKITDKTKSTPEIFVKDITYIDNNHIQFPKVIEGKLVKIDAYFDDNKNLIKANALSLDNKVLGTAKLDFDTKNSPYRNIRGYANIAMVGESIIAIDEEEVIAGNNNLLQSSISRTGISTNIVTNYSYMYNNNGYPTEKKWQYDEYGETTIKYSYNK
ncbi:hypothetical protein D1631_02240 [Chryseobacterium nematophagum]|uniref:DUF4595 domain-containing protein n=1 Tax=Chryseobacterium nematophagum TaxID=2305228 RepID=A0A3M7TC69_9FLAO|nr:hypothetical protein [Chryseobacterium nematophagum]RNA60838.1 hypothetical protein D1631_02240 [Chryseobacterium nematophagum]